MKKKAPTVIALSLLITLIISVCVFAGINNKKSVPEDDRFQTNADADKTKTLKLFEKADNSDKTNSVRLAKNGSKLKYKTTLNYDGVLSHDIYVDTNNNEYYYDSLGNLNGFTASQEAVDTITASGRNSAIDEKRAISLAQKYSAMLFGDVTNSFELKSSYYNQSNSTYNITFVKKIGKYGIINSAWCACNILPNGEMSFCSLSRAHDFDEFDESLLDNITDTVLKDFVSGQIADGVSFEITAASLVKDADTYRIDVDVTETHGEDVYANTYRYALS